MTMWWPDRSKPVTIAFDFDGTVVTHQYPAVGRCVGGFPWLVRFVELGARLVLLTMRDGKELEQAVQWCEERLIRLWGVNENPEQAKWTGSRKVYANLYIDDMAFGVPLVNTHGAPYDRPHVDWSVVGPVVEYQLKLWSGKL